MLRRPTRGPSLFALGAIVTVVACAPPSGREAPHAQAQPLGDGNASVAAGPDRRAGPPQTQPVGDRWRRFEGEVVEVVPAGSYAYVAVRHGDELVWVVTMGSAPTIEDRVWVKGMGERRDFRSRRLERSFDHLIFGSFSPA